MEAANFSERLQKHRPDFEPVVPFRTGDKIIEMSFSGNTDLTDEILANEDQFIHYVYTKLQAENAKYGIGGYDEHRTMYRRSNLFGSGDDEEPRRLHLGIDIWGRPHTPVIAPLNGIVHSLGNNNDFGDYGATVILSHQLDGIAFHTLYGHLSLNTLKDLQPGQTIMKGDIFGEFGMSTENGHWPPHLHFQIIIDLEGMEGNYPGVCKLSEREKYLQNCPDADLILNMMELVRSEKSLA